MPSNIHSLRKPSRFWQPPSASPWRPFCFIFFLSPAVATGPCASGARDSRKVSFLEDPPVVQLVPGGDERQRPHRHPIIAGRPTPHPLVFAERAEQREACASNVREFLH